MGLNIYLEKRERVAGWGYGSFAEFRRRLALQVGIELDRMEGFGGTRPWSEVEDPIRLLLNHSDCDGELNAEACAIIEPRLRELVSSWEDGDFDKQRALLLAEAMREASESESRLLFS